MCNDAWGGGGGGGHSALSLANGMQVVLNVKGSSRTTGSGHNREVVALYRWSLVQVPLNSFM